MLTKIQLAFSLLSRHTATNESEIKSKLSRGANAIYSASDPCTRICIYLLYFFSPLSSFLFFFYRENALFAASFDGRRRGGTKSQRAKSSETREWNIRADPIRVCRKTRDRLKLNPLKGISPCVHSCTLGFAADSFRALAPLLHIKIKKSVFKFNPPIFLRRFSVTPQLRACVFFF